MRTIKSCKALEDGTYKHVKIWERKEQGCYRKCGLERRKRKHSERLLKRTNLTNIKNKDCKQITSKDV